MNVESRDLARANGFTGMTATTSTSGLLAFPVNKPQDVSGQGFLIR